MTEYTAEEHQLLAEVERKAGTIPPGVREVITRRRAGASQEDLERLARESLKGDLVARAVVLDWLEARSGATEAAPAARPPPAPVVKPLEPAGH
ncbi:MAG: hypothetical protein QM767_22040 [Anaeromyxobacter sp.]